jgi:hypothetical protein
MQRSFKFFGLGIDFCELFYEDLDDVEVLGLYSIMDWG